MSYIAKMANEIAKALLRQSMKVRTDYMPLIKTTINKTKYELFLLFGVSVHELVYWNLAHRE
jgi:hypothetical protein